MNTSSRSELIESIVGQFFDDDILQLISEAAIAELPETRLDMPEKDLDIRPYLKLIGRMREYIVEVLNQQEATVESKVLEWKDLAPHIMTRIDALSIKIVEEELRKRHNRY